MSAETSSGADPATQPQPKIQMQRVLGDVSQKRLGLLTRAAQH
jgi:hypothetical protein